MTRTDYEQQARQRWGEIFGRLLAVTDPKFHERMWLNAETLPTQEWIEAKADQLEAADRLRQRKAEFFEAVGINQADVLHREQNRKHERAGIDDRAKQHMDADWNGHGARLSLMFEIGRRAFGKPFEDWALKTARTLFKAGKPANPFTTQHQERN